MRPALLCSFVYLENFQRNQPRMCYRDWALDSGAYSAWHRGVTIDLQQYIETCRHLLETDAKLVEVFALDVIGDWKASLQNCEAMWKAGVPAIPTYHIGEPVDALMHIAKHYPKIALGGVAKSKPSVKLEFAKQCFARVWPKRIHGFAYALREHLLAVPFHSTDSTSWELGPCAHGRWKSFGQMTVRGGRQNLRSEVEFFLKLEAESRQRWKREFKLLESENSPGALRLSLCPTNPTGGERLQATFVPQERNEP
jgi:hypothetical protein